ncbi:MAG: thiamine phosphate synthase [Dehalococcoidia bacterium]|nr:thiamine phosphate synthase [Dehalococcoidia bacterium]
MNFVLDVYVIIDLNFSKGRSLEDVTASAIKGGASMIQLREKRAETRQIVEMARIVKSICAKNNIPFIVNDRVDIALAVEADGVHLGPDDMAVTDARTLLGPDKIIGASAGNVDEALMAQREGASYLGVGAIYATSTKPDAGAPIGPVTISQIKRVCNLPVVGIGGITKDNAAQVITAGAEGVAVISAAIGAQDIVTAVRDITDTVKRAKLLIK